MIHRSKNLGYECQKQDKATPGIALVDGPGRTQHGVCGAAHLTSCLINSHPQNTRHTQSGGHLQNEHSKKPSTLGRRDGFVGKAFTAQGAELESQCKKPGAERRTREMKQLLSPWSFPSQPLRSLCLGISPGRVSVLICILKALRSQAVPQQCRRWVFVGGLCCVEPLCQQP